jgi:hypothetical protein
MVGVDCKTPGNKTSKADEQFVHDHIKSFPVVESHSTRKDTNRKYLAPELNIKKMYELYKEECTNSGRKPVIHTFYRKMFNTQYNFSFFYPKKDQCSVCSLYEQHRIEGTVPEDVEQNYQVHQQRKEESRSEISKDNNRAEDDKRVYVSIFDLEAVLSVPCSLGGDLYYKLRLSCYNLSFYNIDNKNGQCFLWDETHGGCGSCEVGTCLYLYISSIAGDVSPVKEITCYSDTARN